MRTDGGTKVRECTCKCIIETDIDNNHFYKIKTKKNFTSLV